MEAVEMLRSSWRESNLYICEKGQVEDKTEHRRIVHRRERRRNTTPGDPIHTNKKAQAAKTDNISYMERCLSKQLGLVDAKGHVGLAYV